MLLESISPEKLVSYTLIVTLLTISPGVDVMLVIGSSLKTGLRGGLLTALGISVGTFMWTLIVGFGLVNLLHTYPLLYKIIAILGIFYMLYVGYCEIKSGIYPNKEEIKFIGVSKKNTEYFIKGFFTNMLNPKVGIFYLTFLPQFIQSGQINIKSIIFLGSIHIIIGIIWLTFCSSSIDYCKKFINNKKVINYLSIITGIIIISFAVFIGWQAFYSI